MPPKTLDIVDDLQALKARGKKIRTAQRLQLGDLVLETGAEKVLDADAFKDLLRWGIAQLKANPRIKEEWRRQAEAGFPGRAGGSSKPASLPARPAAPDLLAGAAAE